jgi:hypothetical protein
MPRRWIVISLDGLATAAVGAYGSSWNETPAIDRMASQGTVFDRAICTHDHTASQLKAIWGERGINHDFVSAWKRSGRVELFVNAGEQATLLSQLADQLGFDQCTVVETNADSEHDASQNSKLPPDDIEDTSLAQLFVPVLDRLNDVDPQESRDWSLLWIHSDLLTRCWDAPRWLFPIDEEDDDEEPIDQVDWLLEDFEAASADVIHTDAPEPKPPGLFESTEVPKLALNPDSHPDLVTSWMQTYGCQVRLLDRLMELLLEAIESFAEPVGLALVGTSGFSLGQNGWIGHRAGSIRTPQIHVPIVLFDGSGPGIRRSGVQPIETALHAILPIPSQEEPSLGETKRVAASEWSREDDADLAVTTQTARAKRVITTPQWFFVQESGDEEEARLYLKPDDRDDMNDVADRCRDVVDTMHLLP